MRGDQPVVSAASLIVSASIRTTNPNTAVSRFLPGREPPGRALTRLGARPARLELLLELRDLRAALGRLGVIPGLGEEATALGGRRELGDLVQEWHPLVLPVNRAGSPRRRQSRPRPSAPSAASRRSPSSSTASA